MQQNPISNTIQRRVGFEIETGIPLTKRVKKGTRKPSSYSYEDLTPSSIGDDLKYPSKNVKLVADHIDDPPHIKTQKEDFDEWPIIELVTDPIDDNMSLAEFKNKARQWIDLLKQIKQKAQRSPPARELKKDPNYYVGLPSDPPKPYNQWDRIAPQMTAGIPLNRIGNLLTLFELSGTRSQYRAIELSAMAPKKATLVTQDLLQQYPSTDGSGIQALKGLLTMMCNYLLIGKDVTVATIRYFKNRPATIFPKTKLSTIQQNIIKHPYPRDILLTPAKRARLKTLLLNATNRKSLNRLFIAGQDLKGPTSKSTVTVGGWIDEVLTGADDHIFDEMKNPWSREITPDAVDEVVIEYRRLGNFIQVTQALKLEDDSLLNYMWKVYAANSVAKMQGG
jgi:hypothetical protein